MATKRSLANNLAHNKNSQIWLLFSVLLAITPIVASSGGHAFIFMYLPVMLMALVSYYFMSMVSSKEITWNYSQHYLFWIITGLMLWGLLSSLWATNVYVSIDIWLRWFSGWLAMLITIHWLSDKPKATLKNIKLLYRCLALIAGLIVLFGLGQYLFGLDWVTQPAPPAATFKNKNVFSQYMVVMLPLMVVLYLQEQERNKQWLYGLIVTLTLVMIVYARTRAAWLAVILQSLIAVITILFIARGSIAKITKAMVKARRWQFLSFTLLLILMIHFTDNGFNRNAIVNIGIDASSIIDQANVEKQSGNIRLVNWLNTLEMIKENGFLGVGLGNWQLEYPRYKLRTAEDWLAVSNVIWNYAHNDYLETAASLGWIGILFMLGLAVGLVMITKTVMTNYQFGYQPEKQLATTNIAALLSLLGLGITALFSFPLQLVHSIVFAFTLVGVILATFHSTAKLPMRANSQRLLLVISVILTLVLCYHSFGQYQAREAYRESGKYLRRSDYANMLPHAEQAYRWKPWSKETIEVLGIAQSQLQMRQQSSETYARYIKLYPNNVSALENATISFLHTQRYPEAMNATQRLLTIEPDSIIGNINMGTLLYAKKGDFKKQAASFYYKALQLSPNHPQRQAMQQIINEQLGKH